jgi:hypothetical protein
VCCGRLRTRSFACGGVKTRFALRDQADSQAKRGFWHPQALRAIAKKLGATAHFLESGGKGTCPRCGI